MRSNKIFNMATVIEKNPENILKIENFSIIQNGFTEKINIFPSTKDDEIVISGMGGRFPKSDNVAELSENLYNKVRKKDISNKKKKNDSVVIRLIVSFNQIDMINDEEIRYGNLFSKEIPSRKGILKSLDKFDSTFFGIHEKQGLSMDPQTRVMHECAYEAILDSGYNPQELRNSRTGVYAAVCFSEAEKMIVYDKNDSDGHGLPG